MSTHSREMKRLAKQERFDEIIRAAEHRDDKSGDEHRRMAAHAHVMTHHALEMDDPDAHRAAAAAHQKVAEMHEDAADSLDEESEDGPESQPLAKTPKGPQKR